VPARQRGENGLTGSSRTWLLLTYKVPRDPTSTRVHVWRKLKQLGAVALQDAVWVLPATPQTREQLQWLAAEIEELDGEATLWESRLLGSGMEHRVIAQFTEPVEAAYREILREIKKKRPDLASLSKQYQQIQARDYFRCDFGKKVRAALVAAQGDSER
jgi:DNA-binding transcriptional regulator PaaX